MEKKEEILGTPEVSGDEEFGGFGRLENSGDWQIAEVRKSAEREKSFCLATSKNLLEPRKPTIWTCLATSKNLLEPRKNLLGDMESQRFGKRGTWGVQGIGSFWSLEGSGDWEIRESAKTGRIGKIITCGKKK